MIRAAIVGASGYAGGELLRLLLAHPQVEVTQITSETCAGRYAYFIHPNLRGHTDLRFTRLADLDACDLLFLALPHGHAMNRIDEFAALAERILAPNQPLVEVKAFTASRVPPLEIKPDQAGWERYARELRERTLNDVIFRGEAKTWRDAGPAGWPSHSLFPSISSDGLSPLPSPRRMAKTHESGDPRALW